MFNDLIVEDFMDTYNNLTLKTLFMLKYVQQSNCTPRFVMKVDDDIYLNLKNLYRYALYTNVNETEELLTGKLQIKAEPYRTYYSKW